MTITDKIKTFLKSTSDISLGYNEINFFDAEKLEEEQVGYSFDSNGKSLLTGHDGDWQKEWLVIASDNLGDPILVDTSLPQLTVLCAAHGQGTWEPFIIADGLDNLKNIISLFKHISKNRTNPVELEKHPIGKNERRNLLGEIRRQNPNSEIWYWENLLDNE
jgi:hypothetical protein